MGKNNHLLFCSSTKMSDIILENYALLTVLPRFDIPLGFGELTIGEVCKRYGVNEEFFLLVANVYTFSDYLPDSDGIASLDMRALVDYLQQSHKYYRQQKIDSIENQLRMMGLECNEVHNKILLSFFEEYKREVLNHFRYEEEQVFPYIESLYMGLKAPDFNINQYEQNHSNIEDKLSDLKNIIIKYLPESCSCDLRNRVLFEIFLFEDDLIKHSLIEDKVLVPFVEQMEQQNG